MKFTQFSKSRPRAPAQEMLPIGRIDDDRDSEIFDKSDSPNQTLQTHADVRTGEEIRKESYRNTLLWQTVVRFFKQIPASMRQQVFDNFASSLNGLQVESSISFGSGCSGSEVWMLYNECVRTFLEQEWGLTIPSFVAQFAAESDRVKRDFIASQFPELPVLLGDVKAFSEHLVKNHKTGETQRLDFVSVFGAGFSCKSASRQNKKRKNLKGAVQKGIDSTGHSARMYGLSLARDVARADLLRGSGRVITQNSDAAGKVALQLICVAS